MFNTPKQILIFSFFFFSGSGLYALPEAVSEPQILAKTSVSLEKPFWSTDSNTLLFPSSTLRSAAEANQPRQQMFIQPLRAYSVAKQWNRPADTMYVYHADGKTAANKFM